MPDDARRTETAESKQSNLLLAALEAAKYGVELVREVSPVNLDYRQRINALERCLESLDQLLDISPGLLNDDDSIASLEHRYAQRTLQTLRQIAGWSEMAHPEVVLSKELEDVTRSLVITSTNFLREALSTSPANDNRRIALQSLLLDFSTYTAGQVVDDSAAIAESRTNQAEAAGSVAESELAHEFSSYSSGQRRDSWRWLKAALVAALATVVTGLVLLNEIDGQVDWRTIVAHLLIALPFAGVSAYCSREATRRREAGQWAERLAVQLKSVSAYASRLDQSSTDQLLTSFGHYVFGPHETDKDKNQIQSIPPEILQAVADAIRSRMAQK